LLGCLAALVAVQPGRAQDTARKETIIPAAELAPAELRADRPAPGKWWLRRDARDWGAPAGILLTGQPSAKPFPRGGEWTVVPAEQLVPYRLPGLRVEPKLSGWYRIYVGLYSGEAKDPIIRPQLLARLTREPYPEYLRAPEHTATRTTEIYWTAANLTGQALHIDQAPGPMPQPGTGFLGGITHLRLVPMTAGDVAAARQEIELPPQRQRLFGMLDYTDEVFWWGTAESADDIRAVVYRHQQTGFGRIYWRVYGSHLDNSLKVPEAAPRWTEKDEAAWCKKQASAAGWLPYINLTRKFDPLQVAVAHGDKIGCEVHAWVRFTNHNRPPYANFWHDHPELCAQLLKTQKDPKTGKPAPIVPYQRTRYPRVLSMAYPAVRAYYIRFFQEIARSGTLGILIDLLRHPPIAGYEPIVTEAFKKKYGMDMETRDLYRDPLVQEHLSEYLRLFLVDLRKAVGNDIEIGIRTSGPDGFAVRGKEWIAQGLVNTLIDGNWYSGNGPRPTIGETVNAVGSKGHAFAIAESNDVDPKNGWRARAGTLSAEANLALSQHYSGKGVERFGLYETTLFTYYPDLRRAVRLAGWRYQPNRKTAP
jgi:hypothetical protein